MLRRLVGVLALYTIAQAASAPALWTGTTSFESNTFAALTSAAKNATNQFNFAVAYPTTPKIFTGVVDVFSNPGVVLDFDMIITSVSATGITTDYNIGTKTTFRLLQLSVMSVTNSPATSFLMVDYNAQLPASTFTTTSSNLSSGYRMGLNLFDYTAASGTTVNTNNVIKLIVFLQGILMDCNTDFNYNATFEGSFVNSSHYMLAVSTSGNVTISRLRYSICIFDQSMLQANQTIFIDAGYTTALASTWSQLTLSFPWKSNSNFMAGLNSLSYPSSSDLNFTYNPTSLTCSGALTFNSITFGYWNYRYRTCPAGYPLFWVITNLCYDACPPYSYYAAASLTCESCLYSCYSCTTPSTCLSCNPLDHRTLNGTSCSCISGYSDLGVALCVACNITCSTCMNSLGCLSCSFSNFRSWVAGQCPCIVGYVENGTANCVPCTSFLVGCASCSSTTICTVCNSMGLFVLSGSTCACQDGYYLSGSICVACGGMPGCLTCSSATVCTSCSSTYVLNAGLCVCASGTYFSSGSCVLCPTGCASCTSATNCLTCSNSYVLSSCLCQCITGQYPSTAGVCLSCSASLVGCQTCPDSLICTTCNTTSNFSLVGTACACQPGYYQSGSSCIACSLNCLTCTPTACTSCSSPYVVDPFGVGVCSCPYYSTFDAVSNTCVPASMSCGSGRYEQFVFDWMLGVTYRFCYPCMASNCYYCDIAICYECSIGFYLAGTVCVPCPQGCIDCLSSTLCTACITNLQLNGGVCQCAGGFASDGTGSCVACSTTLAGCLSCSDLTTCTSCDTFSNFITDPSNSSQCICAAGFYLSGGVCLSCRSAMAGCESCTDSATCTSCNATTFYAPSLATCACISGYYSSGSACLLCPVGCTTCDVTGTTCTSCDIASGFTISGASCICTTGLFLPSGSTICAPCTNLFWVCTVCSISACSSCQLPAIIGSGSCLCPVGFYNDTVACQPCPTQIAGCITCSLGSCLTCDATLLFQPAPVSGACACQTGLVLFGGSCVVCSTAMAGCTSCTGVSTCLACDTALSFILTGTQCSCVSGSFINSTNNCQLCSSALLGCQMCTTATTCTSCLLPMILLPNKNCGCQPGFVLSGTTCISCMVNCVCYGYQMISGVCTTFCSDGITIGPSEQCDDGNLLPGDGCSSTCTIEPGFACTLDVNLLSSCGRSQPMNITLLSTLKKQTSNTVVFTFSLSPAPALLGSLDFSQAITTDLANSSQLSYSYDGNGLLTLTALYNTSIQGQNMTLNFNPANGGGPFLSLSPSNISFTVQPNNNLAAVYSDDSVYQAVDIANGLSLAILYGSFLVLFASLFVSKFIGIEMMGVVQVAFIALMTVVDLPPLLSAMTNLIVANGYNQAFDGSSSQLQQINQTMPYPVTSLSYLAPMAYSLNYTLILVILPLLASLCLFIASKVTKGNEERRSKLVRWSWLALGEWGFTAILFVLYHAITSFTLFVLYNGEIDQTMLGLSIADALVMFGLLIASLALFKLKPEHLGDYRKAFNTDTLSQYHYFLIVASKLTLATVLVAANSSDHVNFICMVVPLLGGIYIAIKRPYKLQYNNIRASINEFSILLILGIYGYLRAFSDPMNPDSISLVLPCFEVALLMGCVLMNGGFIVKYWWDSRKKTGGQDSAKPVQQKSQTKDVMNEKLLEMSTQRASGMISKILFQNGRVLASPHMVMNAEKLELKNDLFDAPLESPTKRIRLQMLLGKKKSKQAMTEITIPEMEMQQIEDRFEEL